MRKFVGQVNGKTFDNIEDFGKAALDALTSGDDTLSITSYLKECDCDNKCVATTEEKKLDNKITLSTNDLLPNINREGDVPVWNMPDTLKDHLPHITVKNREDLMEFVKDKICTYVTIEDEAEKKIETLEKELTAIKSNLTTAGYGRNYYARVEKLLRDTVYDFQKRSDADEKPKTSAGLKRDVVEEKNDEKSEPSLEQLFENIGDSFGKWLKDIGFWDNINSL